MTTATANRPAATKTVATADGAGAEMKTIHSAFRRELRLAPALLRSVEHGDRLRAGDRRQRTWTCSTGSCTTTTPSRTTCCGRSCSSGCRPRSRRSSS